MHLITSLQVYVSSKCIINNEKEAYMNHVTNEEIASSKQLRARRLRKLILDQVASIEQATSKWQTNQSLYILPAK